jgi:hypothetical protein
MTRADNTRYLAQAAARRHQAALAKASQAIERLDRTSQPVTFSAVAAAAGVSRAWLYRDPAIRDLISQLRTEPAPPATTRAAQRATAESLRTRLDAAREEITRLRAENAALRQQAARHLGQQRAQR